MNRRQLAPLLLALFLCVPAHAAKKEPVDKTEKEPAAKVLATVNGNKIPLQHGEILLADQQRAGAQPTPLVQAAIRKQLIVRELLVQEARRAKLDKTQEMKARTKMAEDELLASAYRRLYLAQHPAAFDDVQKAYDAMKQRAGDKEYRVRHILLENEEEAKGTIARLKAGEKFAALAAQSRDASTREKGGDLGNWVSGLNLQPHIAPVLATLKKDEISAAPVKGPAGWHVLQLDDVRPFTLPPLDDAMRQRIGAELAQHTFNRHIGELAQKAKVE